MTIIKIIRPLSAVAYVTNAAVPQNSSILLPKSKLSAVYSQPRFMCNAGKPMRCNKKKAAVAYKVLKSTVNTMTMPA
ncbi:hypothetical protein D3C80_980860 [compost metagenome]